MAKTARSARLDHVDRWLARVGERLPDIDLEVERIVDRIGGIGRRLNRALDDTLGEFGLDTVEYRLLNTLAMASAPYRSTPGRLARRMDLSTAR
jgi:hypothetical protein